MILKAFNIPQKDYKDEEDFFLNCEAFIGPEDESYVYEVYSIYVISLKRLCESFTDNGIMLNKGWIIQKKYNEYELKEKINSIIKLCDSDNDDETYLKLNSYFIMQDTWYARGVASIIMLMEVLYGHEIVGLMVNQLPLL